jgi:tRNA (guanine37-N1)-methyltransferase
MQFDFITIFPDIIHHYANESIIGRAQNKKLISVKAHNLRRFSEDKWGHVDDKPYSGGAGMILQIGPIVEVLKSIKAIGVKEVKNKPLAITKKDTKTKIILLDPAGKKFDQKMAEKFSKLDRLVFICGRYEGVDARVSKVVDERVSVGDYVLAGGELPALAIMEATARLIPHVLGNAASIVEETTAEAKEYPQYTRPEDYKGWKVPKMLLSGNHAEIASWKKKRQK